MWLTFWVPVSIWVPVKWEWCNPPQDNCWGVMNHAFKSPSWEDQHRKDAGSVFILILCEPGREQAWVTDSIALDTEFTSCLEATQPWQCSSVLWTQASQSHGSAHRIVWKIILKGDVFWAISVLAYTATFNSAFTTFLFPWALSCKMLCEAQKWEKVAFVNLAKSYPELVNSAKGWFFQPLPLPKDIHTHKKTVFREYCVWICQ